MTFFVPFANYLYNLTDYFALSPLLQRNKENLHARSQCFNFLASLLMKVVSTIDPPDSSSNTNLSIPDPLQLLRTMFYEYPPFLQRE